MASGNSLAACDPQSYEPPATNYATPGVRNQHPVLEFDSATQESAVWTCRMPRNYTAAANIIASVTWCAVPITGNVGWDITFERIDTALDIDVDDYATAQVITATTVAATSGVQLTTSVTITGGAAGTDSVAAGELFRVRLRRDVALDTAAGDAQVLGVELREA